jgi:hypothetical protein
VVGDCGEFRGSAGCTHSLLSLRSEYWPHKAKNFQSKLTDNLKDMPFSFLEPAPSVHPLEDCSCFLLFITWSRELYVRAASAVLNMWQWKLKLDDDKSKHAGFGSAKWFWQPSCTQFIEAAKKAQYSLTPSREKCNKI